MPSPIELFVSLSEEGERLDHFIRARLNGVSRGSVARLIERGQVMVAGRRLKKGHRVSAGQHVVIAAASWDEAVLPQPELPLRVILTRPHMVVVNKDAGVACHPLVPGETDTMANAIVGHFPECGDASPRPREGGLVHRLDYGTSGLLIAARTRSAYTNLRAMFSGSEIAKEYLALVVGHVDRRHLVDLPIEGMPGDRRRVRVVRERSDRGQPASSEVLPEALFAERDERAPTTLVRVKCSTGRRHQVRVHMSSLGHPLVGDPLYGGPVWPDVHGAFLHAHRMKVAGDRLEAGLPTDRLDLLRELAT
ncbi:MAG: RluA family pseudouridine synthase [Myxococcales bacterium]|nr:RluA family pseudouridine synthase [Myxococcales bacterium]